MHTCMHACMHMYGNTKYRYAYDLDAIKTGQKLVNIVEFVTCCVYKLTSWYMLSFVAE